MNRRSPNTLTPGAATPRPLHLQLCARMRFAEFRGDSPGNRQFSEIATLRRAAILGRIARRRKNWLAWRGRGFGTSRIRRPTPWGSGSSLRIPTDRSAGPRRFEIPRLSMPASFSLRADPFPKWLLSGGPKFQKCADFPAILPAPRRIAPSRTAANCESAGATTPNSNGTAARFAMFRNRLPLRAALFFATDRPAQKMAALGRGHISEICRFPGESPRSSAERARAHSCNLRERGRDGPEFLRTGGQIRDVSKRPTSPRRPFFRGRPIRPENGCSREGRNFGNLPISRGISALPTPASFSLAADPFAKRLLSGGSKLRKSADFPTDLPETRRSAPAHTAAN